MHSGKELEALHLSPRTGSVFAGSLGFDHGRAPSVPIESAGAIWSGRAHAHAGQLGGNDEQAMERLLCEGECFGEEVHLGSTGGVRDLARERIEPGELL